MKRIGRYSLFLITLILLSATAFAQATSGSLTGNVTTEGTPLPGVTVSISSAALQGTRTAVTNENGAYFFPALPPGSYTVAFELAGMEVVTKTVMVSLVQTARADATMGVAALAEAITVTAAAPTALETTAVSTNFTAETIENLPVARTITGAAALAPGVSPEGPNNQLVISGAPSYNNLYLINGAVVNDTIRGQPESVFIEDAIQETTILTGNVSAEYGRFTGGVVSAITKSGGNEFSGSFRTNITNDDWTNKTPYANQADPLDENAYVYEATIGGRIIRDRLWFFGAGRQQEFSQTRTTLGTNIGYTYGRTDDRWEAKLTGQITSKHSVVASYLDRETAESNYGAFSFADLESLVDRKLPNTLAAFNYNGILSSNFLVEAQFSQREFAFVDSGSMFTDKIYGTIIRDITTFRRAWSPTFCGVCDDETRDNEYLQLKGTYFLSTSALGNHNIVTGAEDFSEMRFANNHQGGSGYRVWGDFLYNGPNLYFHVEPGTNFSGSTIQNWPILRGSERNDTNTKSLFVNDKWDFNSNWSFNLGLRYDKNDAEDQAGVKQSNDSGFSPRLGLTYDIFGDGRHRVSAGFNRYVSGIDNGIVDAASSAGSPAYFEYDYQGPEINPFGCETNNTCLPTNVVLEQVFNWFDNNVNEDTDWIAASLPGVSARIDGELESPYMDEYSLGYGVQVGNRGYLRADYINRQWSNFYVDVTNLGTGKVSNDLGAVFDVTFTRNASDALSREYEAIQTQGSYRIFDRLTLGGNYTYATLEGNAEGETSNNATISLTSVDSYPEYIDINWNNPDRYLNADVRHRAQLWLSYDQPLGRFGNLNFSLLERYNSGFPYYAAGTISVAGIANPGYARPPSTATYYLEDKEYRTESATSTDLGLNYGLPIGPVELFVQADVLNLFDESAIDDPNGVNKTILTSRNSTCIQSAGGANPGARCASFNPFTTTPVEGTHWQKGSLFGQPTSAGAYQLPLTYRFSVGLRF